MNNLTIDTTMIQTFLQCPRKFYLRFVKGFVRTDVDDYDLRFGKAVHKAFETVMRQLKGKTLQPSALQLEEGMRAFLSELGDGEITDPYKTPETFENLYNQFWQFYENDTRTTVVDSEIVATINLPCDKVCYAKLDTVVVDQNSGKYSVFEYKTTRLPKTMFTNLWHLNPQIIFYNYALSCLQETDKCAVQIHGLLCHKQPEMVIIVQPYQKNLVYEWIVTISQTISYINHVLSEHESLTTEQIANRFPCHFGLPCSTFKPCMFHEACSYLELGSVLNNDFGLFKVEPYNIKEL